MKKLAAHTEDIEWLLTSIEEAELETLISAEQAVGTELIERFHRNKEEGIMEEAEFVRTSLETAKSAYRSLRALMDGSATIDPEKFPKVLKPLIETAYSNAILTLRLRKDLDSTDERIDDLIDLLDRAKETEEVIRDSTDKKKTAGYQERLNAYLRRIAEIEEQVRYPLRIGGKEKERSLIVIEALSQKIEAHYLPGEILYLIKIRTAVSPDPAKRLLRGAETSYLKAIEEGGALFDILEGSVNGENGRSVYCLRAAYFAGMAHHRLVSLYEAQSPGEDKKAHAKMLGRHRTHASGWLRHIGHLCKEWGLKLNEVLKTPLERKEYAEAVEHYRQKPL